MQRVHDNQETIIDLDNLATQCGFHIRFLPSYSPELNPCELIFAQIKNYIRNNRNEEDFTTILVLAFQTISFYNTIQYYSKCIIPSKILFEIVFKINFYFFNIITNLFLFEFIIKKISSIQFFEHILNEKMQVEGRGEGS